MPDADASQTRLLYWTQGAFGATPPAAPPMTALPITADTFKVNNEIVVSQQIRSDRMRSGQLLTAASVNGGFAFELQAGDFDPFLEALLASTFATNVLKNGSAAEKYFTFERGAMGVPMFVAFRDCAVDTFNLVATSRQIVSGDFGFLGSGGPAASATSMLGAGVLTPAGTNPAMAAGPGVSLVKINGSAIGVGLMEIRLTISAGLRVRPQVDQLASREFGRGAFSITGSLKMYFSTAALYNFFIANTSFGLQFTLSDLGTPAKTYLFNLPNCQPSDDALPVSAIDTDIEETYNFQAYRDTGISAMISITRAP